MANFIAMPHEKVNTAPQRRAICQKGLRWLWSTRCSGKGCRRHGHGSPVARTIHSLSSHGSSAIPFIATECSQGTAGGNIARRTLLTSSGRAFPRVAGDGAGANRQKSGVEVGPGTNHRSVCVSLTWWAHRAPQTGELDGGGSGGNSARPPV